MRGKPVSGKTLFVLCLGSFLAGSLFTSQTWTQSSQTKESQIPNIPNHVSSLEAVTQDRDHERKLAEVNSRDIMGEVSKTHQAIQQVTG
ncbi:putative beta-1,3-galactosyltransferase 8 [Morella rubra]|uniref:Putative beta-1,3-galactosyltransferase 8 n=1 Tax=Morella rubra TaxID=262757 RepID=A0A6A1VE23_9ROSI|nr:putative beta-1,3-galactosyltransferase 8 [Morella rubra]